MRKNKIGIATLFILLILIIVTFALFYLSDNISAFKPLVNELNNQDKSAYYYDKNLLEVISRKSITNEFKYKIRESLYFENSSCHNARITNTYGNDYLMVCEIALKDSEELLYRSEYIQPGQRVDEIKLLKELKKKDFDATAYFYVIDKDSLDIIDVFQESIILDLN